MVWGSATTINSRFIMRVPTSLPASSWVTQKGGQVTFSYHLYVSGWRPPGRAAGFCCPPLHTHPGLAATAPHPALAPESDTALLRPPSSLQPGHNSNYFMPVINAPACCTDQATADGGAQEPTTAGTRSVQVTAQSLGLGGLLKKIRVQKCWPGGTTLTAGLCQPPQPCNALGWRRHLRSRWTSSI